MSQRGRERRRAGTHVRHQLLGWSWLMVLIVAPLLQGAAELEAEKEKERRARIAKLSRDISKVDHTIKVTKELIKNSPDAPYLPDLYFRLAELYVERSRYVYARLIEKRAGTGRTLSGEKALEVKIAKRLAIETYDKILEDYPSYDQLPKVRFFRAHEYRELGEFETMLEQYEKLIEEHPRSRWGLEARLILADHHFDADELEKAREYYRGILGLPESHVSDMARYKLGWIAINQERFEVALRYFEDAVRSSKKKTRGAVGDARKMDVKREALMASAWPFSEVRKPKQAAAYFSRLADSKTAYVAVLKKLANRYFIKTEYNAAAKIYRSIVRLSSDAEENIEYVQRIYDAVRNMSKDNPKRYAHASSDVRSLVEALAACEIRCRFDAEQKETLAHNFEILVRDLATQLHRRARRTKSTRLAALAARAYKHYLTQFTDAENYRTIQVNRAEALAQAGRFVKAGRQYEDVAIAEERKKERKDLIYSSLHSYFRAISAHADHQRKNPGTEGLLNELQLLRAREGLKQLGAYYVRQWPKDKRTPNVKFNVARMYYDQGQYERSVGLFEQFVEQYPGHEDAATAAELALDALNKLDKFTELSKLAKKFSENSKIKDRKFRARAASLAKAARERNVEMTLLTSAEEGDFGEQMLEQWEQHKDSEQGEDILYAAFVKYRNENSPAGVFDFGGRLIGAYPDSEHIPEVLVTMGNMALRVADFKRAAFLFEEYYKRFSGREDAVSLLDSAARTRAFLGDYEEAVRDLQGVVRRSSGSARRTALERLMRLQRRARDWAALAKTARSAQKSDQDWVNPAVNRGIAHQQRGQRQKALRAFERATQMGAQTPAEQRAKNRAWFSLGRLLQQDYAELQFGNAATAEQVLAQKLQMRQQIENAYVQVIQGGEGRWAIAALHEAVRLYRGFAQFIRDMPVDSNLAAADKRAIAQSIAQQEQAFTQKAEQTLQSCADKAKELRVLSPFAQACLRGEVQRGVTPQSPRVRVRDAASGEAYAASVRELRDQLANSPENPDLLLKLARITLRAGDYNLAKLVLSKAAERVPNNPKVHNLLGVANWQLGMPRAAQGALKTSSEKGSAAGKANLAALYWRYGYAELAQGMWSELDMNALDLTAVDTHPGVDAMVEELGGS